MTFVAKNIRSADLYNENFNHFFTEKLNGMSESQKKLLPIELSVKVFKYGPEASAERLNFNEKAWILSVVFNCKWTIVVEDAENGIDAAEFKTAVKVQRGKKVNGELLEELKTHSAFVLGGKELISSIMYMAHVSCSSIYQLVKKHVPNAGHKKNQAFADERQAFVKTLAFIKNYEANKRRITSDYGLTMPQWYALVNFAIAEGFAIDFYKRDFVFSYQSNKMNLHAGMKKIFELGYLDKRKSGPKDKYYISAKGMDLLNRIFTHLLLKV